MPDETARAAALRLCLASDDALASSTVVAEFKHDPGHTIAVLWELASLTEEAVNESHPGGFIAWIQDRLVAELDAAGRA